MKTVKKITAIVLSFLFVISSFPAGVVSFGGDNDDSGSVLHVGYFSGMTLEELVKSINNLAKIDENTPVEEWSWYTNGIADYSYGRYLIDIKLEEYGYNYENVNVIRGLEIYRQYQRGEITESELKQNYKEVDVMFNDIKIDADKLEITIADALDVARRNFRRESKYVSFKGSAEYVNNKIIELDTEKDPHCAYDVTITQGVLEVSTTLYLPTRLEVSGKESYPSVLSAVANGETVTAKHGDKVYTIQPYGIPHSEIVLTGKSDDAYVINYNVAAGDVEKDILDRIYNTVVDFDKSTLADNFDREQMNGFTVSYYYPGMGWYQFGEENTGRLEAGKVYDVELIYEGDTTETVEFQIALFDPRINPSIAIYGDEKLVVEYTGNVSDIKQAVFNSLIDKSDLPSDVKYTDFEYYYMFGGFSKVENASDNPKINKKFLEFKEKFYDQIWETVEETMGDHPIFEKVSKEEFKEKYFTVEVLEQLINEERWISFDGGYYPIVMEIEGTEVTLFEMNMPEIFAAMSHKIKVVYKGNGEYAPAETETVEKVLQIAAYSSDLDVIDGCYQSGSDVKSDLFAQSYSFGYFAITFEIDTVYLEITNIYIDFPKQGEDILTVRFSNGNLVNIMDYLKQYLAKENYKITDLIDFLQEFEGSELSTGILSSSLNELEILVDKLPESAYQAPINYNGLPVNKEGTYFVAAATADLNSIANRVDYGLCFIVSSLDRDYQIIFSSEIPEEGLMEYPDFDFSAFVFNADFEPFEENPIANNIFIGYDSNIGKIVLTYDSPVIKGQYIQISTSSAANPVFRYFDIGLGKVSILSPGEVFEYDGLPHGEPLIFDYLGNEIPLTDSDRVIYTNTLTLDSSKVAPHKVGIYSVTVIFAGREDYAPQTATYSFRIVPKTVDVWVEDLTVVYGDKLPQFVLNCSDKDILSEIEYTVAPNASYDGSVGEYGLVINIKSLPEGYEVNKLGGKITVTPRPVKIEMNDVTMTYGDEYDPTEEGYYTVVEGSIIDGDYLGLQFEKFNNAGEYVFAPIGYTNKNYDLTVEDGSLTIKKKAISLTIKNEIMTVGDQLPEFTVVEECPEDLVIHIAPSYFTGEVGEYLLVGYCDNPNYIVTIHDGKLYVNPQAPKKVTISTDDYTMTYGDDLPEFVIKTSEELDNVEFIVTIAGDYEGDVGTYPLSISAVEHGETRYAFEILPGKITVEKRDINVKIDDYTVTYGDKFDPKTEYKVSCDDEKANLNDITFEIGAEGYNGQAGSYLFIGKGISRNYNITVQTGILTIDPKTIVIVPTEGQGKFEGEADGEIDYTVSGLIGKDTLEGLLSRAEGEEIGLYEILLGNLNNPNYKLEIEKVMYAIRSKDYRFIRVDSLPTNPVYLQGTDINLEGLIVTAVNADGSETVLNQDQYQIFGFDKDTVGKQKLTVYFEGHIATFEVMVTPTNVLNIKVDKLPSNLVYIEGQEFTSDGMTVVVFYDNGTYSYVDPEYIKFSGFDMYTVGTQTVTAEYAGKTDNFEITVIPKESCGIEVDISDVKTEFVQGTPFSYDGIKVYLVFTNGTRILVEKDDDIRVEGHEMNKVGDQIITVTYGSFTSTYEITVIEKKAVDLEVKYDGDELFAVVGNKFNSNQVKVIVTFNDGTTKVLKYGEYQVTGYDADVIGIWNAAIEYGGISVDVVVRVVAFSIEKVEVTKIPNKLVYYFGEKLDISGIEVTVYYNNNTSEKVVDFDVYGFDTTVLGIQNVTVSYLGYKAEYKITVVPNNFEGIEIGKLPNKTEYIEKTALDLTGIEVYMICGEERIPVDFESLEFSECDMTKLGVSEITVSYAGYTASFEINIIAKKAISITTVTDKIIVCIIGSEPEVDGTSFKVEYDNGESEIVDLAVDMFGEYDNTKVGKRDVEIIYAEVSITLPVWFIADEIKEIHISKNPKWNVFTENTEFSAEGIEILVNYSNGTSESFYEDDCDFYGFDMSVIGVQTVIVRYANMTASYEITVTNKELSHIEIEKLPNKIEYVYGQQLDINGLTVKVYYDNGEYYVVDDTSNSINVYGYDSTLIGNQTIIVEVNGLTTEFEVNVIEIAPVGIELDVENAVYKYYLHNALILDGIKVTVILNNGEVEEVSIYDCLIEGFDSFILGEQTVTVVYAGFNAEFTIEVVELAPLRIEIETGDMSLETTVGSSHDFDKMIVKALYPDGTYRQLVSGSYSVTDYNYAEYGVYNAKVVYGDLYETVELIVLPEFTLEFATEGKAPVYNVTEIGLIIDELGVSRTVAQLKAQLRGGEYIVVTSADGVILEDSELVCTGSKISFVYRETTYGIFNVVVKGDVNGDGLLNITDAVIVVHAIADAYELDSLYLEAADVSENNGFNITDVVVIKHTVAN